VRPRRPNVPGVKRELSITPQDAADHQGQAQQILIRSSIVKRHQIIVYWSFVIDTTGPRFRTRAQRRAIHKVLSRKRLRDIEQAALLVTTAKLPTGFTATVS
jgi:hypothetical protein